MSLEREEDYPSDYPVKRFKEDTSLDIDDTTISTNSLQQSLDDKHKPVVIKHDSSLVQSELILKIEQAQSSKLLQLNYSTSSVTHIYNPVDYASDTHSCYVRQYGNGPKRVMFLGMNPGPFGMAQNGVPFGDVTQVKEWLQIKGHVSKPDNEHSKRPVHGLACTRNEVSGTRFWGLIKSIWKTPKEFFKTCYVHNYCPLCFMTSTGRNVTPPSLKSSVKTKLQLICDTSLIEAIDVLQVNTIVCVGKYVQERATKVAKDFTKWKIQIGSITHPSPINPSANKGDWIEIATEQLKSLQVVP